MEFGNFFKLLKKHRLTLVIVPIVAVIITFFLVRNQADSYISQSQIATGIVDQTNVTKVSSNSTTATQDQQVGQAFSNLIEILKSKKMLDQISYKLILHDLKSDHPYRKPSKLLLQLNESARQHAIDVYTDKSNKRESLSLFNQDENGLAKVLGSMKYDDQSLLKKMTIYRAETSDFINIEYESENPQLSATVVNTLTNEFITYYTSLVKANQHRAVTFLGQLVHDKLDTLNKRINDLKNYKIAHKVLNTNEEARALYAQIADFESREEQAKKDAVSNLTALRNIDRQFNPADRKYVESSMVRMNNQIMNTREQQQALNQQYIESGFDESYRPRLDSLNRVIANQINQASDKYIVNPLNTKANLIQAKLNLQIQYDLARGSIPLIENQLAKLNNRITTIVPHEAEVQADESAITVANSEYLDVLGKYNQSTLDANFSAQLRQIETGMPEAPQPSKKMLLVILSAFIAEVAAIVILFGSFYFDNNIYNPRGLANSTNIPVLGYLYRLGGSSIDLRRVWNDSHSEGELRLFRNLLQSIRFEMDNVMAGKQILLINSLSQAEGKTFLAMNLAYAYSLINKRVLLIDGNFENPSITDAVKAKLYVEDYLKGMVPDTSLAGNSKITILGNKGGDISLLEVNDEHSIKETFNRLKKIFDVILIESSALNTLNKSKEWTLFADKVVTVFGAGHKLKDTQQPSFRFMKSLNKRFAGWILNQVEPDQAVADVKA